MSETRFTLGPWIAAGSSFGEPKMKYASCVVPESVDDGIDICEMPFDHYDPEQEANASLIAAAPDLYAVLDQIATDIEAQGVLIEWHQAALNVLAKARGEG